MTNEERHTEVMVRFGEMDTKIGKINTTIAEVLKPAVDQTYQTEKDMICIQGKVKFGQWVGGIIGAAFIFTVVRSVYAYMAKYPHS